MCLARWRVLLLFDMGRRVTNVRNIKNEDQAIEGDGLFDFFAVITPGFEALAEKELGFWNREIAVAREHGGLSFRTSLVSGCELNRVLKIPTRILLRLTSFGCRDFPKLFKKTAGFEWANWITGDVELQASTHKSRLFIKKRIEETCRDGFAKYFETHSADLPEVSDVSTQNILVRINDDVCTFSLDTSGELLHKRGTKVLSAEAPLRETIAAALLTWMLTEGPRPENAVTLIDPMVGSGTFIVEASYLKKPLSERSYAFESFPQYRTEKAQTAETIAKKVATESDFASFIGFDIDAKAAETAHRNWRDLGDPRAFEIKLEDIFKAAPLEFENDNERWLICNPPYGERLKIEGRLKDFYENLFESCERTVAPNRACFILPETARPLHLKTPARWRLKQSLRFQNGGLPVTALLFLN